MLRLLPLVLVGCAPSLNVSGASFDTTRFTELLRDELGIESRWAPRPEVQPALGAQPPCAVDVDPTTLARRTTTARVEGPVCLDEACRERLVVEVADDQVVLRVDAYRVRTSFQSTGMICPGPTLTSYELEGSRSASRRQRRAARRALDRLAGDSPVGP
ncbi:MAG: hypothetical protein H6720_28940 [Sandaracinus sp.]|nr:hypothetical protein [Sandaracinus sp.]